MPWILKTELVLTLALLAHQLLYWNLLSRRPPQPHRS